jgi:hypothetical protein
MPRFGRFGAFRASPTRGRVTADAQEVYGWITTRETSCERALLSFWRERPSWQSSSRLRARPALFAAAHGELRRIDPGATEFGDGKEPQDTVVLARAVALAALDSDSTHGNSGATEQLALARDHIEQDRGLAR